ncbi:ribonuclease Z [Ornithinibacillus gellani]|uniref:ribonuclease Z n=1 Tax=Ornithinibacillus gellani TaxID=2293253 RepID=UPI000F473C63|nr:ribonuclease Z [Ornithinibacillus gellani]TQS74486.1 ribonuclease Z [Ornithinibacillus gellani]
MELLFLGTGAGLPSKARNVTSIALSLLQEINEIWMFDCGEATQHQILRTSIKPGKISRIFITHMHGDHVFGLPGFLSSRSFQGGSDRLTIYGPKGIKAYVETALALSETHLTYPLTIQEITEGNVLDEPAFAVDCKILDHGVQSFGFRIMEKAKLGELQVDKLKTIGISPGPIYQQIKSQETTELPDGRYIERKDFIGPDKPGRIISIMGDTRNPDKQMDFVKDSDVLVHEATFEQDKQQLAKAYFHTTTAQAAELAKHAGVKQLILTHISSRYQEEDNARLLAEARHIFPNTWLAHDFYHFQIQSKTLQE